MYYYGGLDTDTLLCKETTSFIIDSIRIANTCDVSNNNDT